VSGSSDEAVGGRLTKPPIFDCDAIIIKISGSDINLRGAQTIMGSRALYSDSVRRLTLRLPVRREQIEPV
jgi:hypothetical protein